MPTWLALRTLLGAGPRERRSHDDTYWPFVKRWFAMLQPDARRYQVTEPIIPCDGD
jgi:hypothetical protein